MHQGLCWRAVDGVFYCPRMHRAPSLSSKQRGGNKSTHQVISWGGKQPSCYYPNLITACPATTCHGSATTCHSCHYLPWQYHYLPWHCHYLPLLPLPVMVLSLSAIQTAITSLKELPLLVCFCHYLSEYGHYSLFIAILNSVTIECDSISIFDIM